MPLVAVIMGSISDNETMQHAVDILLQFGIAHETHVVSAHRTPEEMFRFAKEAQGRGLRCIIAGAGGAAHLPGMVSSLTPLPVLGVPILSKTLHGVDSLLSIVQMPKGVPTATFAVGPAGAANAALFAVRILAHGNATLQNQLEKHRALMAEEALASDSLLQKARA
ncbi:MAG: 5-(carboxyamino)imidazole ribonucleotide mutase [Proteobacteria bacterium]|nr:5-(carboxyamino)imidazole ribonucleotide mutase [Cystobacterineae bacterium]MCL2259238.1 5-(carboxyamino)imidazole ribonucleotide mutase [Cystobacterineae bacterium]MCL2314415.1 5-(carboxyamino)imidazole ribonucleotide mutase [Pseudomonadota bacterium]